METPGETTPHLILPPTSCILWYHTVYITEGNGEASSLTSSVKKRCNVSYFFTLRREELGGDEALHTFRLAAKGVFYG